MCGSIGGDCLAVATAAHTRFIVWILVLVIGDLLLIASWLALETKMDPHLGHLNRTIVPTGERPPHRQLDAAFFYQPMPEDLMSSHDGTNEDPLE